MLKYGVSTWKAVPLLRILVPLITGIIIQHKLHPPVILSLIFITAGMILFLLGRSFKSATLFRFRWMMGLGLNLIFFAAGCLLVRHNDIQNDINWAGNHYKTGDAVIVTIQEPLVEKQKSYKALATIESVNTEIATVQVKGKLLVYFQKDSSTPRIHYGSQVLIVKPLQPITNSGNPGGFDYKQYCAFQGIHHQVFLKPGDYKLLSTTRSNWFDELLIKTRGRVLSVLRDNIKGKDEVAVAEALLIGYRDDLDRELVQSYSNTGVVHIIAISGLHLGMIYGLMVFLFSPFKQRKWNKVVQPLTILFILWMFTFLAGAVPSISRSAVMFTCIILGEALSRRTSVYNTLAASAFLLLLYDPFYLWDVGFQLSFAAVLSIVAFSKHINNWFYFQNRILNKLWGLSSVTLSAQLLTLPVILYHFHQFPNLFLFTNIIIVPLSGLILFTELLLLLFSFIPFLSALTGSVVGWLTWIMNTLIERTDRIPFAVTDGIQVTLLQSVLLSGAIICGGIWLLRKNRQVFFACCASIVLFFALRSIDIIHTRGQQKLIVYNVPQHTAIDVVEGNTFCFIGDSDLLQDNFLRNFHLRPSRILNRMNEGVLQSVFAGRQFIRSGKKKVIIIDDALPFREAQGRIKADAIIITRNPRLYIDQLVKQYDCNLLVFDATNPLWKIRLWKKDCDSLHLRHHSVPESGAFEMDL